MSDSMSGNYWNYYFRVIHIHPHIFAYTHTHTANYSGYPHTIQRGFRSVIFP